MKATSAFETHSCRRDITHTLKYILLLLTYFLRLFLGDILPGAYCCLSKRWLSHITRASLGAMTNARLHKRPLVSTALYWPQHSSH